MIHINRLPLFILLVFSLLLLSCHKTVSHNGDDYASKEADAYYDSLYKNADYKFIPVSVKDVVNKKYDYVKVIRLENPAKYNPKQLYCNYCDSILLSHKKDLADFEKYDLIINFFEHQKIGTIPWKFVVKEEKKASDWAVIYIDSEYEDEEWGYWLALSHDNGKTWNKYYTGLTENYYYYFKRNSKISLWKDSNTLQIEGASVRKISESSLPIISAKFEIIQDSIAIQLNLAKIIQDSDHDGLTDIVENKLLLNPMNPDTDGDDIEDSEDKNPRFKSEKTDKSKLYEALIENNQFDENGEMDINLFNPFCGKKNEAIHMSKPYLLVTTDRDLQKVPLYYQTIIVVSPQEYERYKLRYPSHLPEYGFTRMFKCDKQNNFHVIDIYYSSGTSRYVLRKTWFGWKIFLLSSCMS